MDNRIFKVDFFPHEWLTQTSHMTPEERGIFINICAMIYARRGAIKNDPAHIARACNCSPRLARSVINRLLESGDISIVDGDFITQKRCENVLNVLRTYREHGANGGRISAELRQESRNINGNKSTLPSTPAKHSISKHITNSTPLPPSTGQLPALPEGKDFNNFIDAVDACSALLGVTQLNAEDQTVLCRYIELYDMNWAMKIIYETVARFRSKNAGAVPKSMAYFEKKLADKSVNSGGKK